MLARHLFKFKNPYNNIPRLVCYSTAGSNSNSKVFLNDKFSSFTFDEINRLSSKLSSDLLASLNKNDLQGEKIAVLCANNYTYLISVLAVWMANGVPLG
jgi:acyl-CoA synthetase (AMP-forming)/AMP-acid ligase II